MEGESYHLTRMLSCGQRLPLSVAEMVAAAPFQGEEGIQYLGNKESVVLEVDRKTLYG